MTMQLAEYVREREGDYFVDATRVTLRSVIADWKRGRTPEQIAADFPGVPLVAIYGAITTYLERQQEFDGHFAEGDVATALDKAATEAAHPEFYAEMRARLAQVRPQVEAELRAQGILPEESTPTIQAQDEQAGEDRDDAGITPPRTPGA
jgi:uncharacterized protein (DUF433 family)